MRLKANKTWSQQQLAIKLRVEESRQQWMLSWEQQRLSARCRPHSRVAL
jgi:hypothetical protein